MLSTTHIGDFTQVANSKAPVYCWQFTNENEIELLKKVAYMPGFNVYNVTELNKAVGIENAFNAADGDQFLMAFCPLNMYVEPDPADDWLISPALEGGSTFTFKASPFTNQFGPETIEICYATEDTTDPSKFTVSKTISVGSNDVNATAEWQTVSVNLPSNVSRVAIHYVSQNTFGLKLDAFDFTPKGGKLSIVGYEVFRSEGTGDLFEKITDTENCEYLDNTLNQSVTNSYYVRPAISNGSHGLQSNIVYVAASGINGIKALKTIYGGNGIIVFCGFSGENVTVYNLGGAVVATGVATDNYSINMHPGVYVVKAGNTIAKTIVF